MTDDSKIASSLSENQSAEEEELVALRAELIAVKAEVVQLRQDLAKQSASWQSIRVSSPLTDVEFTEWQPRYERHDLTRFWNSWCPCCKRPLDIACFGARDVEQITEPSEVTQTVGQRVLQVSAWNGKPIQQPADRPYAYVAALWGDAPGFALGALVLGRGLIRSGTKYDLVLLHTSDVPNHLLQLLEKIWKLRPVEYVHADEALFGGGREGSRFSAVFTKLHALGLVEYEKIMMLDIDLAVLDCADALFDLPAPAALWRGQSQTKEHGFPVDGRCFFGGSEVGWKQTGGINAGVMILAPDSRLHARALQEVQSPLHPERIPGSGPEQDYLSRFFAPYWTHLSVLYNFQLHQIFFSLEAAVRTATDMPFQPPVGNDASIEQSLSYIKEVRDGTEICCVHIPPKCDGLPVFESPDSFRIVCFLALGETVLASGTPVWSKGCPMIPLRSPLGAIDGRQVQVVAGSYAGESAEYSWQEFPGPPHPSSDQGLEQKARLRKVIHEHCGEGLQRDPDLDGKKQLLDNAEDMLEPTAGTSDLPAGSQAPDLLWLPGRLSMNLEDIHIVHFSGELKMWDRNYLSDESDDDFVDRLLRNNTPYEARLWLDREGSEDDYALFGVRCENGKFEPIKNEQPAAAVEGIIDMAISQARGAALRAAIQWREDLELLPRVLESISSLPELLHKIGQQCAHTAVFASLQCGDRVEVHWGSDDTSYSGTVRALRQKGVLGIEFDDYIGVYDFGENSVRRI